jgi:TPR repeat protein
VKGFRSYYEPEAARQLVLSVGGLPLGLQLIGRHLYAQGYGGQPRDAAAKEYWIEAREQGDTSLQLYISSFS